MSLSGAEIEAAVTRAIAPLHDQMVELQHDLTTHQFDTYAHPQLDRWRQLQTLWDERNEFRGILRFLAIAVPASAIFGPAVAVALSFLLNHWR